MSFNWQFMFCVIFAFHQLFAFLPALLLDMYMHSPALNHASLTKYDFDIRYFPNYPHKLYIPSLHLMNYGFLMRRKGMQHATSLACYQLFELTILNLLSIFWRFELAFYTLLAKDAAAKEEIAAEERSNSEVDSIMLESSLPKRKTIVHSSTGKQLESELGQLSILDNLINRTSQDNLVELADCTVDFHAAGSCTEPVWVCK